LGAGHRSKELRKDGISVVALYPGPTRTELWPASTKPLFPMQSNAVVHIALKKLGRKTTVVAGWKNSITVFSTRLLMYDQKSWPLRAAGATIMMEPR
jgi:short-subunit dehydrogenase